MAFGNGDEKSKEDVYRDRNVAVVGLLRALQQQGYEVGYRRVDDPRWPAVYAVLPSGEVGWHIRADELDDFGSWLPNTGRDYSYYDRETKNDRLIDYIQEAPDL